MSWSIPATDQPWGLRQAGIVADPEQHLWELSAHLREVAPADWGAEVIDPCRDNAGRNTIRLRAHFVTRYVGARLRNPFRSGASGQLGVGLQVCPHGRFGWGRRLGSRDRRASALESARGLEFGSIARRTKGREAVMSTSDQEAVTFRWNAVCIDCAPDDYDREVAFYRDLLGTEVAEREERWAALQDRRAECGSIFRPSTGMCHRFGPKTRPPRRR